MTLHEPVAGSHVVTQGMSVTNGNMRRRLSSSSRATSPRHASADRRLLAFVADPGESDAAATRRRHRHHRKAPIAAADGDEPAGDDAQRGAEGDVAEMVTLA